MSPSAPDGFQVVAISPNMPGSAPAGMNGDFSRMTLMPSPEMTKPPSPDDHSGVAFVKGGKRKRLSKASSVPPAVARSVLNAPFPPLDRPAMLVTRANAAAMALVSSSPRCVSHDVPGFTYRLSSLQQLVGALLLLLLMLCSVCTYYLRSTVQLLCLERVHLH